MNELDKLVDIIGETFIKTNSDFILSQPNGSIMNIQINNPTINICFENKDGELLINYTSYCENYEN
jgi:hypothetical protein